MAGSASLSGHTAVLAAPAAEALLSPGGGCYIDATFGGGGHSRMLLQKMPAAARLLALDCDEYAAARAADVADSRFCFLRRNFAELAAAAAEAGIAAGEVRGVLFDLGVSSMQLESAGRGMSFSRRGPLDMRLDRRAPTTLKSLLESCDERELVRILRNYGEEPEARRVGRAIYARRRDIADTAELAQIIADGKRARPPGRHPATLVFQALRIAVNRELDALRRGLEAACALLSRGGRLAVIAFHSLEDRVVKRTLSAPAFPGVGRVGGLGMRPLGKATTPSAAETKNNPRARSARMRVFVKAAI
ncbi:MAG: 16S rRNA (cytosine(1402)-N(4))-methyltransferase RsmH [Gammaproteobacteria bacterium]